MYPTGLKTGVILFAHADRRFDFTLDTSTPGTYSRRSGRHGPGYHDSERLWHLQRVGRHVREDEVDTDSRISGWDSIAMIRFTSLRLFNDQLIVYLRHQVNGRPHRCAAGFRVMVTDVPAIAPWLPGTPGMM